MKNKILLLLLVSIFSLYACENLDLNPLSKASSENWYSTDDELKMSVSYLYSTSNLKYYSPADMFYNTDDFNFRSVLEPITSGTINGQTPMVKTAWVNAYTCIASANQILVNLVKAKGNVTEENLKIYAANAKFIRAAQYSKLIFLFGDVPYYTNNLSIAEAFSLSRTKKENILDSIYVDYDFAAQNLPITYSDKKYATKGAALAMKARIALYMHDYSTARNAAKACIDLGIYKLFPSYSNLFLNKTKNSVETIFCVPYSVTLGSNFPLDPKQFIVRTAGGFGGFDPSWDLLCSYLCSDGLTLNKSPLFNPREPFKNRDPRCTATIVEFGAKWLGYTYQVHPDTLVVMNYNTNTLVPNRQNRAVDIYSTYNGLVLKKFIDNDWLDFLIDNDQIIMRYADVLLMYAEAKIELGEIDQTLLDAINMVRARAYGVNYTETSFYPVVTKTSQTELRKTLRIERRMEFAFENDFRYNDIIRWKLAEKVLNRPNFGLLDPADLRKKIVNTGLWFFPEIPLIDEDGTPDFTSMYNSGLIKMLTQRKFDATKQYLWPIPTSEIIINKNLIQNPGY